MTQPPRDIERELSELNTTIAELGGEVDQAYEQVGGESVGAQDREDAAAALTNAQEIEAILQPLYDKRDRLRAELEA